MPKSVTANRATVSRISLKLEGSQVVGLEVAVDVNYGSFGQNEVIDLWAYLTPPQKAFLQTIADRVSQLDLVLVTATNGSKVAQDYLAFGMMNMPKAKAPKRKKR